MTTDVRPAIEGHDLASYSNFRFFAEMLLADTLPREIEGSLLTWHHDMGGRLGETFGNCSTRPVHNRCHSIGTSSHRSNRVLMLSIMLTRVLDKAAHLGSWIISTTFQVLRGDMARWQTIRQANSSHYYSDIWRRIAAGGHSTLRSRYVCFIVLSLVLRLQTPESLVRSPCKPVLMRTFSFCLCGL